MKLLDQRFIIGKKWFRSCLVAVEKPFVKSMMILYPIKVFPVGEICFILGNWHVWLMTSRLCKQWNKIAYQIHPIWGYMLSWSTALRWPNIIVWFQCGNFVYRMQGEECQECAMTMQAIIVRKLMWKIMRESGTPLSSSSTYSFYTIFHSLYR